MSSNPFRFEIRRLVLVDSAGFCYVELPVDRHALLLGSGNLGKSSLLNALRLFLLPENNFRKSQRKFGFRNSRSGTGYTNEESFQHYFPSRHSFLIMEVVNPAGTHCQILHRNRDLGYGRIFAPVSWADLRPLFWRADDDPDGIGRAVPELSVKTVSEAVRRMAPRDALFTQDRDRLRSLLYASDLMSDDAMRYSVLPLADADDRSVESLRTLILLLFEMRADEAAMARAVASIVEADKKFSSDALDLDIDQFLQRHQQLKKEHEHLTRMEKERRRFDQLAAHYHEFREKAGAREAFAAFGAGLVRAQEEARHERELAAAQVESHRGVVDTLEGECRDIDSRLSQLAGAVETHQRQFDQYSAVRRDGETLRARYPADLSLDEVRAQREQELAEETRHLNALRNEAAAEQQRTELAAEIERLEQELQEAEARARRARWQLHHQLPEAVAAPLGAVQPRLLQASPGRALETGEMEVMAAFARLLEQRPEGYAWFDESFAAQASAGEDPEARRAALQEQLDARRARLAELSPEQSGTLDRPGRIRKSERVVAEIEASLALLEKLPAAEVNIREAEQALAGCREQQQELEAQQRAASERREEARARLAEARSALGAVDARQARLEELRRRVERLQRQAGGTTAEAEPLPAAGITSERLDAIELDLEDLELRRREILEALRYFAQAGMLAEHAEALHYEHPDAGVLAAAFEELRVVFAELPEQRRLLQERIGSHNESVASYRQALKVNAEHVERFQRRLNTELEGVAINDLAEVRVDIHCDPRFRNLVEESEALDPYSGELLSDAFYERLRVFVAEFFDPAEGARHGCRLTMDRIITGISYRTRKHNETGMESKSQSTSTTMLINLELVRRLLQGVLAPGVALSFPLVLDEVANVDVGQIPGLLERLQHQGFNLFAAATHSASSELIHQIGRHCELGRMHTRQPYDKRRTVVFWGGAEGFTHGEAAARWLDHEQFALLEEHDGQAL